MHKSKLENLLMLLELVGKSLLAGFALPISLPFLIVYWTFKDPVMYAYASLTGKRYDNKTEKIISKAEYERKEEEEKEKKRKEEIVRKIKSGKLKTTGIPHVAKQPFDSFLCIENSKDNLPHDVVEFIETEPDETIDNFFRKEADWISQLSEKYGLDFIKPDYDRIRSIMLFPQDFKEMHHGIIWRTNFITGESGHNFTGIKYLYMELNSDSDKPLKQQLEDAMIKIYDVLLRQSLIAI